MRTYRKRRKRRKTRKIRGGFFSGISYFMSKGASRFKVGAPVASGNPSLPVNPFPHSQ